ncbi:hypothetical protein NDU88_001917 [Pleurodeles waltl]|uniref:Uncharacterized protein n=1 Tax=Pleurodeles waltl TaxID=8319 RepID=A0AAV7TK50_PLEWA|nr:hypothetical protein NDU88_001917 [Pleurodeles waltl]
MFGVPRANNAERNPEQRKTAACEHLRCACDAKEKLIGTRSVSPKTWAGSPWDSLGRLVPAFQRAAWSTSQPQQRPDGCAPGGVPGEVRGTPWVGCADGRGAAGNGEPLILCFQSDRMHDDVRLLLQLEITGADVVAVAWRPETVFWPGVMGGRLGRRGTPPYGPLGGGDGRPPTT